METVLFEWTDEIVNKALVLWDTGLGIDEVKKGAGIPWEDNLETFGEMSRAREQSIATFLESSQQYQRNFYRMYADKAKEIFGA